MPRRLALCLLLLLIPTAARAAFEDDFAPTPRRPDDPRYTAAACGAQTAVPQIAAARLQPGEHVTVDGRLDDPVWHRAPIGWGIQQAEPGQFVPPTVPTTFKVAYDADAVYVAVACYEDDMADVASRLSRRDDIQSSDLVSVYLDPYHDRTTGYNFRVTMDGVMQDAYLFNDGDRDTDWDAVWEAETWRDGRGWYVEMRIPFRAIRFKPAEDMTWGLQVYRWLHGRGEDTAWCAWDRNLSGFVSRWGTLTGLSGVQNPRKLELLPYVAGGLTDPADPAEDREEWGRYLNWGADLKYNLTSDLTLNGTFQPDFGQVEADPAVLNLSPFETFYEEKRPFFIEGARFFSHPDFNLFYSRRVGTGDPDSRIRGAAKLTGKLGGSTTLAALGAFTDIAPHGQVHNPFQPGHEQTGFGVVRLGQDFNDGNQQVHVMGGGVWRADDTRYQHETAYTGGLDFDLYFRDRTYNVRGSAVGSATRAAADARTTHGTGGAFYARKLAGTVRGGIGGRWESDTLQLNDLGYLSANDEITTNAWTQLRYNADGREGAPVNQSYLYLEGIRTWLYGGVDRPAWSYGARHPQSGTLYASWFVQTLSFWNLELEYEHGFPGTTKYETRTFAGERGPLLRTAPYDWAEMSVDTDWRAGLGAGVQVGHAASAVGTRHWDLEAGGRVNLGRHFVGRLSAGYSARHEDAQWLDNLADPVQGIDGVAYVFGQLDQKTVDVTLRASYLVDRDLSCELYLQPFLSVGDYSVPRYLARPDTRDLRPYDGLDAADHDFRTSALNANLVLRWQYRPGSTVYLVYTHGRSLYEERRQHDPSRAFDNSLDPADLFATEGANTFLLKVNYWFSI